MPDAALLPTVPTLLAMLGVAAVGLALAVAAIRRVAGGPELARVPLAAAHEVRLDVAGPVVLHGAGPRFTRRFGGLEFRLVDRMSGGRVATRRPWLRTSVAGGARVRLALARFDVPRPGVYGLEVAGLGPGPQDDGCALVFTPAGGAALPLAIVASVATAAVIALTLVALGWRIVASGPAGLDDGSPFAIDERAATATGAPPASTGAPAAPMPAESVAAPSALPSSGRQLRADPNAAAAFTSEAHWEGGELTLRLPGAFEVRAKGKDLDVRDPDRVSTFLVGHSVIFPSPTTAPMLVVASLTSATERLRSGGLDGYAVVRFGGVAGVLTIESRREGGNRLAIWSAYRPTESGTRNTTVIFGAETAEFDRLEATVRAIFASARFD